MFYVGNMEDSGIDRLVVQLLNKEQVKGTLGREVGSKICGEYRIKGPYYHSTPNETCFQFMHKNQLIGFLLLGDHIREETVFNGREVTAHYGYYNNLLVTNGTYYAHIQDGELVHQAEIINNGQTKSRLDNVSSIDFVKVLDEFLKVRCPSARTINELAYILGKELNRIEKICVRILSLERKEGETRTKLTKFEQELNFIRPMSQIEVITVFARTTVVAMFLARLIHYRSDGMEKFALTTWEKYLPQTSGLLRRIIMCIVSILKESLMVPASEVVVEIINQASIAEMLEDYPEKSFFIFSDFYEALLGEIDPDTRRKFGVYHTPRNVVDFMVSSVHNYLKQEYNLEEGLGDSSVRLLDPATGFGNFLIGTYLTAMTGLEGNHELGPRDLKQRLLANLQGYEFAAVPFVCANLILLHVLNQHGYSFSEDDDLPVNLVNSLDTPVALRLDSQDGSGSIPIETGVIIGNPPYGRSGSTGTWIDKHMGPFKDKNERNKSQYNYDYLKFLRLADLTISPMRRGIIAYIVNMKLLDNRSFSVVRKLLMEEYNDIFICNLYGGSRYGLTSENDENIFSIQQDVTIIFLAKNPLKIESSVRYVELLGTKCQKLDRLQQLSLSGGILNHVSHHLHPIAPHYYFMPKKLHTEYETFLSLEEIFIKSTTGVTPGSKEVMVGFSHAEVMSRFSKILADKDLTAVPESRLTRSSGKRILRQYQSLSFDERKIVSYHNYPLDIRYLYHEPSLMERPRTVDRTRENGVVRKSLLIDQVRQDNIFLGVSKASALDRFTNIFVTSVVPDIKFAERTKRTQVFPLFVIDPAGNRRRNLREIVSKRFSSVLEYKVSDHELVSYIYAVLYSSRYRRRYNDNLLGDTPKVPLITELRIFKELVALGSELIDLHLFVDATGAKLLGKGTNEVNEIRLDRTQARLHINQNQYYEGVTNESFQYVIGGYPVLQHYLEERMNRELTADEVDHIGVIISVIRRTIELVQQIDNLDLLGYINRG